ncbi:sirohydrochlorin chelatase [Oceanisphaera ostreae]|uniref:Sirohydrochlorin chelatase n=1 Tax=Oceanisphaera ostreae TaxID=914151 RepID=A0ABW3KH27_9GAMM
MNGFILVAHGSRRVAANQEIAAFAQSLSQAMATRFDVTGHAFWELADPRIGEVIDQQIAVGATNIKLLPYFLAQGTHVVNDLPSVLEQKRVQYPEVTLTLLPHLGALPNFANWLAEQL